MVGKQCYTLHRSSLLALFCFQSYALSSALLGDRFHLRVSPFGRRCVGRNRKSLNGTIMPSVRNSSTNPENAGNINAELGSLLVSSGFSINGAVPAKLILASKSPRRAEILDMMGLKNQYVIFPSPLDEKALQNELMEREHTLPPPQYALILAEHKAKALGAMLLLKAKNVHRAEFQETENAKNEMGADCTTYIIGSDTIVDLDGDILEKPIDDNDARRMLNQLSGRWHKVHTGVSIYSSKNRYESPISSFVESAQVHFTKLSPSDIDAYINTREPLDKAGSYGIQGIGGQMVESIQGDFFAVMGLPMHRLSRELSRILSLQL